jgi:hypothetical protein
MENDLYQDFHLIPTPAPSPTPTPGPTYHPVAGWILNNKIMTGILALLFIFFLMMLRIGFPKEIPGDYLVRLGEAAAEMAKSSSGVGGLGGPGMTGGVPSFDTSQLSNLSLSDLQSIPH